MANYYEKEISVNKRAIEILTGTLVNGMSNGVFFTSPGFCYVFVYRQVHNGMHHLRLPKEEKNKKGV